MNIEDLELVEKYYRWNMRIGNYMLPEAFGETFPYLQDLISRYAGSLVVSHNGTLTGTEKRRWGGNSFATAGSYKTETVTHPANLIPCLLKAMDISLSHDVPFQKLEIGPMNLKSGQKRTSALKIAETLFSVIVSASKHPLKDNIIVPLWEDEFINNNQRTDSIWHHHKFDPLFVEWANGKTSKLYVTEELEKKRLENDQWGAW